MQEEYPVIDMKKTGRNIRKIMLEKGMTVKDLQKYLRVATTQGIYHWFAGRNMPSLDNIYALSKLFGVTVNDMLKETSEEEYCINNFLIDLQTTICMVDLYKLDHEYKERVALERLSRYAQLITSLKRRNIL